MALKISAAEKTAALLNEAADYLEALVLPERATFSMSIWGNHPEGPEPKLHNLCNTAACAAGWLSLETKWRRRKFRSKWVLCEDRWVLEPDHVSCSWIRMGTEVFGADRFEMIRLFGSIDSTRTEVIQIFRDLAKEYEQRATP